MGFFANMQAKKEQEEAMERQKAFKAAQRDLKKLPEIIKLLGESEVTDKKGNYITTGELVGYDREGNKKITEFEAYPCPITVYEYEIKENGQKYYITESEEAFKEETKGQDLDPNDIYFSETASLISINTDKGRTDVVITNRCDVLSVSHESYIGEVYAFGEQKTDLCASDKFEEIDSFQNNYGGLTNFKEVDEMSYQQSQNMKVLDEIYLGMVNDGTIDGDIRRARRIVNAKAEHLDDQRREMEGLDEEDELD